MPPSEAAPQLLAALRALTEPSPRVREPAQRQRARLLAALLLTLIPFSLVSSLLAPALGGAEVPGNALTRMGLVASAVGVGLYALSRSRHHQVAAALTVLGAVMGTWGAVLLSKGTASEASSPYFLSMSVILASVLLPMGATLALAGANLAAVLALPRFVSAVDYFDVVNVALFLFFVSAFIGVFAAVRRHDLRRIEAQARRLAESEEQLRSVMSAAPAIILQVDRGGRILYINRTVTERAAHEVVGERVTDHVPPGDRERIQALVERAFATGEAQGWEVQAPGPGESLAWYSSRLAPILRDGEVVAATLVSTDITQLKRAEEERARSAARAQEIGRLEEVARFKANFMNMAAHELRTPLTPITTHLYLLGKQRARLDEDARRSLEVVERNARRMAELLQDVLDGARIQAGRLEVKRRTLDLDQVVRDAAESFRGTASQAGLALDLQLAAPLHVDADPGRLSQVLFNLLSNAIKFTPPGGRIEVATASEGDSAVLIVRDTGHGFAPEQVEKLFQPFSQIHHLPDATSRGTGLGLYITKEIVQAHGGRIEGASPGPGRGTTFRVTLPLAREVPVAQAA